MGELYLMLYISRRHDSRFSGARGEAVIVTEPPPLFTCSAGIGLRLPHVTEIAAARPHLGFIEVHAENYIAETAALDRLLELRRGDDRVEFAGEDGNAEQEDEGRQENDGKDDPASQDVCPGCAFYNARLAVGDVGLNRRGECRAARGCTNAQYR